MTNIIEVENKMVTLRNQQVILDSDVAELYGVETKRVNEAVSNNPEKFPEGYIWELAEGEIVALRSKISTLKKAGRGQHSKYPPQSFHRERSLHAGHDSEESESGRDHHRHRGGLREVKGTVAGDSGDSTTGRELHGTENIASARRTAGGGPDDRCAAGPEQRDLHRTQPRDVQTQAFREAGERGGGKETTGGDSGTQTYY